jgi:hypothetical protein
MQSSARLKRVIATRFSLLVLLLALVWGFNLQSPSTALASSRKPNSNALSLKFQPSITFHRARVLFLRHHRDPQRGQRRQHAVFRTCQYL